MKTELLGSKSFWGIFPNSTILESDWSDPHFWNNQPAPFPILQILIK
jgi:hypothetical protein